MTNRTTEGSQAGSAHSHRDDLIEQVQALTELCVRVAEIAARFHLDQDLIRFVIQRGRLPEQPLRPSWHPTD